MKGPLKILVLFTFIVHYGYAQESPRTYFLDELKMESSGSRISKNTDGHPIIISQFNGGNVKTLSRMDLEKVYLGTPYFGDQWFEGELYFNGGKTVKGLMAYNLVNNTVYYSLNKLVQALEVKPDKFILNETTFIKLGKEYGAANNFYHEVLSVGEPMLLKQYTGRYSATKSKENTSYATSQSSEYEGTFEKQEKIYIALEDRLIPVSNRKSFFKKIGHYAKTAKRFTMENNLNLKEEEDALKLIKHLQKN